MSLTPLVASVSVLPNSMSTPMTATGLPSWSNMIISPVGARRHVRDGHLDRLDDDIVAGTVRVERRRGVEPRKSPEIVGAEPRGRVEVAAAACSETSLIACGEESGGGVPARAEISDLRSDHPRLGAFLHEDLASTRPVQTTAETAAMDLIARMWSPVESANDVPGRRGQVSGGQILTWRDVSPWTEAVWSRPWNVSQAGWYASRT